MSRRVKPVTVKPTMSKRQNASHRARNIVLGFIVVPTAMFAGLLLVSGGLDSNSPNEAPLGPMGGPVTEVEFAVSEEVEVGGIYVEGSLVEMGQVPLDTTVVPTWTLHNRSDQTISLGEPHASVVEGCCPGPLTLTVAELAPGETTELSFPLQMHPGMDGLHDFDVHVPIVGSNDVVTLGVTGDFRN